MTAEVQVMTVRLPVHLHRTLRAYAFFMDETMNALVVRMVEAFVADKAVIAEVERARQMYRAAVDDESGT